jgi:hypothetical protein
VAAVNEVTVPFAAPTNTRPSAMTRPPLTAPPADACQRLDGAAPPTWNAVTPPLESPTTSTEAAGSSAGDPSIAPATFAVHKTLPDFSAIA